MHIEPTGPLAVRWWWLSVVPGLVSAAILPAVLFGAVWVLRSQGVWFLQDTWLPELLILGATTLAVLPFSWRPLGLLLNRTHVSVQAGQLVAKNGPVPGWGDAEVPVSRVREVALVQTMSLTWLLPMPVGVALHVGLDDGRRVRLVGPVLGRGGADDVGEALSARLGVPLLHEELMVMRGPVRWMAWSMGVDPDAS